MTTPQPRAFHQFPRLPAELRLAVWRLCLPRRVLELDSPRDDIVFGVRVYPPGPKEWEMLSCAINWQITAFNTRLPVIARVCREARAVVHETWIEVPYPEDLQSPTNWGWCWRIRPEPWFDCARTKTIHLGWSPGADIDWECSGDPIRNLLWLAELTEHHQVSITLDFLTGVAYTPDYPDLHLLPWRTDELADLMRQWPAWIVVILEPIIVHANVRTDEVSDLFGLLGDSRVQIIAADDVAQIDKFFALRNLPGVTVSSNTSMREIPAAKVNMEVAVRAIFGWEKDPPNFQPSLMFRLCTQKQLCSQKCGLIT